MHCYTFGAWLTLQPVEDRFFSPITVPWLFQPLRTTIRLYSPLSVDTSRILVVISSLVSKDVEIDTLPRMKLLSQVPVAHTSKRENLQIGDSTLARTAPTCSEKSDMVP